MSEASPPVPEAPVTELDPAVLVLGMHRSGTSWLAGALKRAGLFLGRHSAWNPYNQRGNQENPDVVELHDRVLAAAGGAWNDPPARVEWSAEHLRQARELAADMGIYGPWGFKDPRVLLVLEGWRQVLGSFLAVGIFRHPGAVAASLAERDLMAPEEGLRLWQAYNLRLLAELERKAFPLLCFDWAPERLAQRTAEVCTDLGLDEPEASGTFFAPDMRHERAPIPVPAELEALYDRLRSWADGAD